MAIVLDPRSGGADNRPGGDAPETDPTPLPGGWISSKKYGSPIPLVFGRAPVPGIPVWRGPYISGGGYVWDGANWLHKSLLAQHVLLALCEAPVDEVIGCFKRYGGGLKLIAPANYVGRVTLDGGACDVITAATATAWSVYGGTYAEGISHSGTCHVRLTAMILDEGGVIPDTRWIVQSSECVNTDSGQDAHPALMLEYLLTNQIHGLGYPSAMVDVVYGTDGNEASGYRRYCNAMAFYVSRAITEGEAISDIIEDLLFATNSTLIWVDGKLKAVPLSDEAVTRGSFTYTPVTSTYQIGNGDFVPGGGDPVSLKRRTRSSVASVYPVKYLCRSSITDDQVDVGEEQYISDIWIAENGIRKAETIDLSKWILSPGHVFWVSYATSQRAIYHRTTYTFKLGPRWAYLAPGDFVAITDSTLGISGVQTRLQTIEEDSDGILTVEALEWPLGATSNAPTATTPRAGDDAPAGAKFFADYTLSNVADGSVGLRQAQTLSDRDNLVPNPSSELAPPDGADTSQPEWAKRYNAGAGAYSGSWVRQLSAETWGFWVPCSPGAQFYAEAQAKRTSGSGSGLRMFVGFYPTLGSFSGGSVTNGTSSTSGSWTKVSVLSAVAGAGMCAAFIGCEAQGSDVGQFDALYARRVITPEIIQNEYISTTTTGTGWTATSSNAYRVGGLINMSAVYTAGASAAWNPIFTMGAGSRPINTTYVMGRVYDSSSGSFYPCTVIIAPTGDGSVSEYDDGTGLVTPFAIGTGDQVFFTVTFVWQ